MTKRQFLNSLKKELKIFNDDKQEKYYEEYKLKLNIYIKDGLSEEEAIKKLGNVSKIIDDILESEKNSNKNKDNKKNSKDNKYDKNKYIRVITDEIKDFVNKLGKLCNVKTDDDLLKLVVQIVLVFICVLLLKIPFYVFKEIGFTVFSIFPNILSGLFSLVWGLLVQIAYFITSIYLVYVIVKRIILDDKTVSNGVKEIKKDIKEEVNKFNKNDMSLNIMKVLLFIITLPLYFIAFLLFIGLGIVVGFMLNGVMLTGILLIVVSLLVIFTSIIGLVNHMIFGGRK